MTAALAETLELDPAVCPTCQGDGQSCHRVRDIDGLRFRVEWDDCLDCGGTGEVPSGAVMDCPACDGQGGVLIPWPSSAGRNPWEPCEHCHEGQILVSNRVSVLDAIEAERWLRRHR